MSNHAKTTTKGHGCMCVHVSVYAALGSPATSDEWHKALLLPDNYEILRVERKASQDLFELTLLSEDIPAGEGIFVDPFYIALFDDEGTKTPRLNHIEMSRWSGKSWEVVR